MTTIVCMMKLEGPARVAMEVTRETAKDIHGADAHAAFWRGVECGRVEAVQRPDALVVVLDDGVTEDERKALAALLGRLRGVAAVRPIAAMVAGERASLPSRTAEPAEEDKPAPVARPRVGEWQLDIYGRGRIYDERGTEVGDYYDAMLRNVFPWEAKQPFAKPIRGDATTPAAARAAVLEVLSTWCDVAAARPK